MDGFMTPKKIPKQPPKDAETTTVNPPILSNIVAPTAISLKSANKVPPHHRLKWIFFKPEHVSRKKWLLVDAAIILGLFVAAIVGYAIFARLTVIQPLGPQPKAAQRVVDVKPKLEPSRLTGVLVDPNLNSRPVTGIMIENSPDARPQSGLTDAGVVVEAIAEGGITRFLALFQDTQPQYIGPVRSVRPYYFDFALAFNASVAHVGGSPEALRQIRGLKIRDLDQFYNSGAYWRVSSRYAPHNVYTSMAKLDQLNKSKGFTSSNFTSWPRKKDQPSKTPTASSINMNISGFFYNTHYDYDTTTNSYKRSEGGKTHLDEKSKKQITPKVVIAVVMSYSIEADGKHSQYGTIGSGKAYIFQDGTVTQATWHKADHASQITFTDAQGKAVSLNAGQTWLTLVGNAGAVSYR